MYDDNKIQKMIIAFLALLVSVNIAFTYLLNQKNKKLQHEIDAINSSINFNHINESNKVEGIKSELEEFMNKKSSLLLTSSIEFHYDNNKLVGNIEFEPKMINKSEKIYIEATSSKETIHKEMLIDSLGIAKTTLEMELCDLINITVVFEDDNTLKKEKLDTVNINSYFELGLNCNWNSDNPDKDQILSVNLYKPKAKEEFALTKVKKAEFIIQDWTGNEVGREDVLDSAPNIGDIRPMSYTANLTKYFENKGWHQVILELTTEEGITYKSRISSFEKLEDGSMEYWVSSDAIHPSWE